MRYVLRRSFPPFTRVLLIESGSRPLFETLLPTFYENHPGMTLDLVTCYAGVPTSFRPEQGTVYRVTDYPDTRSRGRLYKELAANRYTILGMICDLVTCYAGAPRNFRVDQGSVYRVTDYPAGPARQRFYRDLSTNRYNIIGIICSAEPIMTKWKWMLAARLSGKVFVLNENCDYFWLDHGHLENIRYFILFRAGLTGSGAVRTIARVVLFPFSLLYLILYAMLVHSRRILRTL